MINTKIINLFAGPGAGKSTIASGLFYELKRRDIKCDVPYEYPKQLAWNESFTEIKDQFYVIANQHRGIVRSYGKVEYIILDSPILLSLIYKDNYTLSYPASLYDEKFDDLIFHLHNSYDNINIVLNRPIKNFEKGGRFHDEEESMKLDSKIVSLLNDNSIPFYSVDVGENTINDILNLILNG